MFVNISSRDAGNSHHSSKKSDNNSVAYPSRTLVHPKLEMTEPGDADEREADAAAHDVMSGKVFRKFSGGGAGGGMAVSSQMESQLNQLQGGGQRMPDGLRGMMERGFDRDFSQVRLHTDGEAAGLSDSIHAKAFTHGNDIYFNQGQYAPETSEGQRLVAHELAHVMQGNGMICKDDMSEQVSSNKTCEYENIVVVGASHEDDNNKMMFVNQALGTIRSWKKDENSRNTFIIFEAEYEKLLEPVKNVVEESGATFFAIDSAMDLINYINNRDGKIKHMVIFAHGLPESIEFGYKIEDKQKEYQLNLDKIKRIEKDKFAKDAEIHSYPCRSGYPKTHNWCGDILAQQLADITRATVYAAARRTRYNKTLDGNENCEPKIKYYNINTGEVGEEQWRITKWVHQTNFPLLPSGSCEPPYVSPEITPDYKIKTPDFFIVFKPGEKNPFCTGQYNLEDEICESPSAVCQ